MGKKDDIKHPKVKGTEMVFRSVSLPASLVEDLQLLKESFEIAWYAEEPRKRVTYEKIFERLLSNSGLGHVEPKVYTEFMKAKETRKEFPAVVTRATRRPVINIYKRMQSDGTSPFAEALKAQEEAEAALEEDLRAAAGGGDSPAPAEDQVHSPEQVATPDVTQKGKRTEKRFVHSDGRQYPALEGSLPPYYAKVPGRGNVGQRDMFKDGFELKDVEI